MTEADEQSGMNRGQGRSHGCLIRTIDTEVRIPLKGSPHQKGAKLLAGRGNEPPFVGESLSRPLDPYLHPPSLPYKVRDV